MAPATCRLLVLPAAFTLLAVACGDTSEPEAARTGNVPGEAPPSDASDEATIVADDIAFDITELDATVGEPLTITFDNRDDGISHNLHVEGTAGGDAKTEIEAGPTTQTLEVSFDDAGAFEYVCDVHPEQMRGTITASS